VQQLPRCIQLASLAETTHFICLLHHRLFFGHWVLYACLSFHATHASSEGRRHAVVSIDQTFVAGFRTLVCHWTSLSTDGSVTVANIHGMNVMAHSCSVHQAKQCQVIS
jgi:hypothetical protein